MSFGSKVAAAYKSTGFLSKPTSAKDAGADDFRPVSGLKPLIHMEPGNKTMWINEDLAPTPPEMRTWSWLTFVSLWWGTNYTVSAWSQGSSLLNYGLSFGTTIGATIVGYVFISLTAVACARVGSRYHIGYPAWARATFGMHLSKFFVGLRGAVAVIWFAVMIWYQALMLDVCLLAVSPNGWGNIPNSLPDSISCTTREMVCYFICWCLHVPFAFVHPSIIKIFFEVKAVLLPIVSFSFLGGIIHLAGGSIDFSALNGTVAKGSGAQSMAWMLGINACFGNMAPMLINQADLGRYSNTPSAAMWPQGISLWAGMIVVTMMGLSSGAASYQIWGTEEWNIWTICQMILETNATAGWRAGIFIFGIINIYATIGQNLFSNNIPAACDLASLWPTRINIVRAQLILMVLSWVVQPWSIITTGARFITFLNSYTFFCGAIIGILLADYYVVRRGNIHIPSLFAADGNKARTDGIYYNQPYGMNLVALGAWILGIILPLPGLAYSYMDTVPAIGEQFIKIYDSGFLISFATSAIFYIIGMSIWKPAIVPPGREDEYEHVFEGLGKTDGYLPGDEVIFYGRHSAHDHVDSASGSVTPSDDEKNFAVDDVVPVEKY